MKLFETIMNGFRNIEKVIEERYLSKDKPVSMVRNKNSGLVRYQNSNLIGTNKRYNTVEKNDLVKIVENAYDCWKIRNIEDGQKQIMQKNWEKFSNKSDANTIVVRDGSISMACNKGMPMKIADSLTIYFSELLKGKFKDKFITFTKNPKLVTFESKDIYSKLVELSNYREVSGGNLTEIYDLLLDVYTKSTINEQIIKRIVIITDIDLEIAMDNVESYKQYQKKFNRLKIEIPEVIYWNMNSNKLIFSHHREQKNIKYIKGSSPKIIEMIINNSDMNTLNFTKEVEFVNE